MDCVRKVLILTGLASVLFGCAAAPNQRSLQDIDTFTANVDRVVGLFQTHLENVEQAHMAALKENTALQFDLGGNPSLDEAPLFTSDVQRTRQKLLNVVSYYAHHMKSLYPDDVISSGNIAAQIQHVEKDVLELSHGISKREQASLIEGLNGVSEYVFSAYRERRMSDLIAKAHPLIERAALLLYLDIGSPDNQAVECSSGEGDYQLNLKLGDLRLCQGGLRSILKTAIEARGRTLRQRLQLFHGAKAKERQDTVDRLYASQKAGRLMDQSMKKTQDALLALIAAHRDLRRQYAGAAESAADLIPAWKGEMSNGVSGSAPSDLSSLLKSLPALAEEGLQLLEK